MHRKVTNISWSKVAVSAGEGFITSGASTVVKITAKVGTAVIQSALDGNKGVKNIAIGAAVNLSAGAVGSVTGRLVKGVGSKGLQKASNRIISSKSSLSKVVRQRLHMSPKRAQTIAKHIQKVQKSVARHVRKTVSNTVGTISSGVSSGVYDRYKQRSR